MRITDPGNTNKEYGANFDRAFADALDGEPQLITKEGKPAAVLLRHDEWEWMKGQIEIGDQS